MNFYAPDNLRTLCGGTWLARPGPDVVIHGVCTDTRHIQRGQVFIALRGDTHDGHAFTAQALHAGAGVIIIERDDSLPAGAQERGVGVLRVADSRKALLRLGHAYRRALESTKVIAVAGSNGKTTTVRLLHAVLGTRLRGTASPKSFNNSVGVPLTILSGRASDQYLICEVGTNAPGEIGALAAVVEPDIAVITSIGREHLEGLGSIDGVAREEATLLTALRPGGVAVVTADSPALRPLLPGGPSLIRFGVAPDADLRLSALSNVTSPDGRGAISLTVNNRWEFTCPLVGEHNALNCLAAIAVARRFNIDDDLIAAGLAAVQAPEMRWQRSMVGGVHVINDAYNANPESMLAAIRTFAAMPATAPPGRRVAVLGDMLELGEATEAAHREIARAVIDSGAVDLAVCIGPRMRSAADEFRREWPAARVLHLPDLDATAMAEVCGVLRPGDTVLLKGSRGMRLERLIAEMTRRTGPTGSTGAVALKPHAPVHERS